MTTTATDPRTAHAAAVDELAEWADGLTRALADVEQLRTSPAPTPTLANVRDAAHKRLTASTDLAQAVALADAMQAGHDAAQQRVHTTAQAVVRADAEALTDRISDARKAADAQARSVRAALVKLHASPNPAALDALTERQPIVAGLRRAVADLEHQQAVLFAAADGIDRAGELPAHLVPDALAPGGVLPSPTARTLDDDTAALLRWGASLLHDGLLNAHDPARATLDAAQGLAHDELPAALLLALTTARARMRRCDALTDRPPLPLDVDALDAWDLEQRLAMAAPIPRHVLAEARHLAATALRQAVSEARQPILAVYRDRIHTAVAEGRVDVDAQDYYLAMTPGPRLTDPVARTLAAWWQTNQQTIAQVKTLAGWDELPLGAYPTQAVMHRAAQNAGLAFDPVTHTTQAEARMTR